MRQKFKNKMVGTPTMKHVNDIQKDLKQILQNLDNNANPNLESTLNSFLDDGRAYEDASSITMNSYRPKINPTRPRNINF